MMTLLALLPAYCVGALPTGYWIARARGVRIDQQGSGNVGAANVARVLGWRAGALTFIADALKGFLSVLLATLYLADSTLVPWAGVAAVAGHCFSVPGFFRGGKGVATAWGALVLLAPAIAFSVLVIYAVIVSWTSVSALGSLAAALLAPCCALFLSDSNSFSAILAMAILIVFRHRPNIERMIAGKWD